MKKAAYLGLYQQSTRAHAGKEYATMQDSIDRTDIAQVTESYRFATPSPAIDDALTEVLRRGAVQM